MFDPATLETIRDALAGTLESSARTIDERVRAGHRDAANPSALGLMTSEWLERLSEELSQWDVGAGDSRLRAAIKNSPGGMLLLAGAAGILLARVLRRR
jgi:hypothetical protein